MNRTLGVILVIIVTTFGQVPIANTVAQGETMIPVNVVTFRPEAERGTTAGDPCAAPFLEPNQEQQPRQIVVRNESDTIIAIETVPVEGEWAAFESVVDPTLTLGCNHRLEITVPGASFYTVFIEETRLVGYAADEVGETWTIVN